MVLIIENDRSIRDTLCVWLHHMGKECEAVADRKTAIQKMAEKKPNVLLADVYLNDGSIKSLVHKWKNEYPFTRIILMSAISSKVLEEIADEVDVEWISKPFDVELLEKMLFTPQQGKDRRYYMTHV